MIAAAIIVLREMLEICLIIGMLSAVLKDFSNKTRLLLLGVGSGLGVSVILALSLKQINQSFNGNGQEWLNIGILSASILCIAWTLIWMNQQGKKLYNQVVAATQKLKQEETSIWPIIFIITLSISREGAELILFLSGVAASANHSHEIMYGALIGAILGVILGVSLYAGLLKISTKYFFKIINVMLIILAAGMSAQLASYLGSIDIISQYSEVLWDSSRFVSESSIAGKLLNGIIGYSSHPTKLQVIFYSATISTMTYLVRRKA